MKLFRGYVFLEKPIMDDGLWRITGFKVKSFSQIEHYEESIIRDDDWWWLLNAKKGELSFPWAQ
jgi:hypothetical protein